MTTTPEKGRLSAIDTNFTLNVYDDPWEADQHYFPNRALDDPSPASSIVRPLGTVELSTANSRGRNEARKLLSHVLIQLANRPKPPSIAEAIHHNAHDSPERSIGALAETLKQAVQRGGKHSTKSNRTTAGNVEEDSDEESNATYTTDHTIDLVQQLKDVLVMAVAQGWQIFDERNFDRETIDEEVSKIHSFRKSRNFRTGGKRSRSTSPSKGRDQVPELLSLCISILRSIVSEDCRYRVAFPRPSRPPNYLQALTLSIAQFLVHNHRHDSRVISEIAFAMIPAFYSFHRQMYPRILRFFETSIVRVMLQNLARLQGIVAHDSEIEPTNDPFSAVSGGNEIPTVSIQIDEVLTQDSLPPVPPGKWDSAKSLNGEIQSTNNPRQSSHIYYLAFLIPPLIGAILDSLDSTDDMDVLDANTYTQATQLIRTTAMSKIDAYNDLLEVIAYRSPKSRRWAIASLCDIWPKSVGHAIISSPFVPTRLISTGSSSIIHVNPDSHQFVPWYFDSNPKQTWTDNVLHSDCRSCLKPIRGFSLMCPSCMTAVHFECYDYPRGNYHMQYTLESEQRVKRIAMLRFSDVVTSGKSHHEIPNGNHVFKPANWFTLCLCFGCRNPLWGCFAQGLKCDHCSTAVHVGCLHLLDQFQPCADFDITSENVIIDYNSLRQSCLKHFPILNCTPEELYISSFEEISIYYSVLQTQLQLLNNGITFGSIIIQSKGIPSHEYHGGIDRFELHTLLEQCESLLDSGRLPYSPLTQQYQQDSNVSQKRPNLMFNWSYLEYVTAAIKTSFPQSRHVSTATSDFLNVDQPFDGNTDFAETASLPYESATLVHIRNILRTDFTLRSDSAAKFILDQLHHLSLFDRMDGNPYPFPYTSLESDLKCIFPLPLGLDLSLNVETLVSSIEASLSDLNLSTNEFGFLLLTRRFWPNGLASEYGLRRLALKVLSWILDEDNNLAIILREYVAKQQKLPGVRTQHTEDSWPSTLGSRLTPSNIANNGGDFVTARRLLLSRYALPWLLELHDLDPVFYCQIMFEACCRVTDGIDADSELGSAFSDSGKGKDNHIRCDDILRSIIKLAHFSVIFTVFDDLFIRWLDFVFSLGAGDGAIPSLHRLSPRENEATQTLPVDILPNPGAGSSDLPRNFVNDPLRAISTFASQSEMNLSLSVSYLPMLIKSGLNIPTATFKHFLGLLTANSEISLENTNYFVKAIALSLWAKSSGEQGQQELIASLHSHSSSQIFRCLLIGENPGICMAIIRQSLAACLRIYGCERNNITATGLISASEVKDLPTQRKLAGRGAPADDPIFIHRNILTALVLYIQSKVDEVTCYVAKFLNMFLTESPFLEAFEIDNFILQNGKTIASCAWAAYDIQREDVAAARTGLLLRSLLIDPEPLQNIVGASMDYTTSPIKDRLSSINRLFRIILDVTSPVFYVEGRQWRSSVIDLFNWYFSPLWADPSEEVRMAVRSSSAALLPAHLSVISQCWSDSLSKAPITERTRLVGFLIQLRAHFPSWKVLSWDCMIETLVEYDYDQKNHRDHVPANDNINADKIDGNYHLLIADPDMAHLQVSIILLGLQMVADGIDIDSFSLMKLKVQFVQIAGFNKVSVVPTQSRQHFRLQFSEIVQIADAAYPCIEELAHVVDAPYHIKVPQSALGVADSHEDELANALIGSVFLDVTLCMLGTLRKLSSLPVLTLKGLLEALYIIVHKYDFGDALYQHLQGPLRKAILRSVEILSQDVSYELRQLSLSIAQASINKCHTFLGPAISTIIELVATEMASQTRNSQDALIVHGKLLIGNTMQMFCNSGLLMSLLRRTLQPNLFSVLHQVLDGQGRDSSHASTSICELLLRDTLYRAVDCDSRSFPTVLQNITYFVETVYFRGYSLDLLTYIGQHLVHLARRMSDGSIEGLDSSPLITIFSVLIQNNKKHSKDLFPHVEVVLRVALNRLRASETCLTRLIQAVFSIKQKANDNSGSNDVINVLFDILLDGFRMKTKMPPMTVKSLIASLIAADKAMLLPISVAQRQPFRNMIDDAYSFLQNHSWNDDNVEHDFQAISETAKLLLGAINRDPAHFQRLTEPVTDKSLRAPPSIRSWNILLLVTLQEMQDDWKSMIYDHFTSFCSTYSAVLRNYVSSGISSATVATTDINQAHLSLRLWLILAHSISTSTHNGEVSVAGIWNEMWPVYESFLNVLETEARVGQYPALVSLASASVADLIVYMRSLKTSLSLDTSAYIAILNRLRALSLGDSSSHKESLLTKHFDLLYTDPKQ